MFERSAASSGIPLGRNRPVAKIAARLIVSDSDALHICDVHINEIYNVRDHHLKMDTDVTFLPMWSPTGQPEARLVMTDLGSCTMTPS
jgi:hypothetical protein